MTAGLIVNIVVISLHSNPNCIGDDCKKDAQTGEFAKYV